MTEAGHLVPEKAVGYVHGSVLGDDWAHWLILYGPEEGTYYRYKIGDRTPLKQANIKQIYV
jgi:hypothetical protein